MKKKTVTLSWEGQHYTLREGDTFRINIDIDTAGLKKLSGRLEISPVEIHRIDI